MRKFLTSLAFMALTALGANAATIGTFEGAGTFNYYGPSETLQIDSTGTGTAFADPNTARHLGLNFSLTLRYAGNDFVQTGFVDLGVIRPIDTFATVGTLVDGLNIVNFTPLPPSGFDLDFNLVEPAFSAFVTAIYGSVPGGSITSRPVSYFGSVSEVPLPATLPLLLLGVGGIAIMRRRKGAAAA